LGLVLYLVILAALLALLCIWIVVPPFNAASIILAVASIELSPYLLVLSLGAAIVTWRLRGRFRTAAVCIFAASAALCALPVVALLASPAGRPVLNSAARFSIAEYAIPIKLGATKSAIRAYLPDSHTATPALFDIYGGAWRSGSPQSDASMNRSLARHGYAVFALDYRHSPAYHFPAALQDIRQEIAFVRGHAGLFHIDADQTGVVGHSSGGQLAELIAFEPHSPVRALISYSGAVDLTMGWKYPPVPDPIGVRAVIENYIGATPEREPARYHAATPLAHVRRGLPPVLLIYGSRDHVVDIRYARKLRDALRAAGTDVTFLELPWTEHAFEDVPFGLHAPIALAQTVTFLRSVFPPR